MKTPRRLAWVGLWAVLALLAGGRAGYASNASQLRIHFIDVGQGDAILVQVPAAAGSARGLNILIDGGPYYGDDRKFCRRVVPYLEEQGLPRKSLLDYMIITHPHKDHYGGLGEVLGEYDVLNIIDSGCKAGGDFNKLIKKAKEETVQGKKANFVELRTTPDLKLDWGPVEARILHRYRPGVKSLGESEPHRASTVIRLAYGQFSFLLMGDAEGKKRKAKPDGAIFVEGELLKTPGAAALRSTVLKAGHHGSETGSTRPFLEAVQPEFVVVMSGRVNYHGEFLPYESVVQRYEKLRPAPTILRTDKGEPRESLKKKRCREDADGDDIRMTTDGKELKVEQAAPVPGYRQWKLVREIQ